MAVDNLKNKLQKLTSPISDKWKEDVEFRRDNSEWLKLSRKIAIRINLHIKEFGIKQNMLAEMMKVSPQQISKILKGRENFTLETIVKIENALSIKLLEIPSKKRSLYGTKIVLNYDETKHKTIINANYNTKKNGIVNYYVNRASWEKREQGEKPKNYKEYMYKDVKVY